MPELSNTDYKTRSTRLQKIIREDELENTSREHKITKIKNSVELTAS